MLTNPTIETLKTLKVYGMLEALEEQQQTPAVQGLSFEERLALLIDRSGCTARTSAAPDCYAARA